MEQTRETTAPKEPPQKFVNRPLAGRDRGECPGAANLLAKPWKAAKVKPPKRSPVGQQEAAERLPGKSAEPVPSRPKGERRVEPAPGRRVVRLKKPQIRVALGLYLHNDPAALFPAGQEGGRLRSMAWARRKRLVTADGRGGLALTDRGATLAKFLHARGHTGN